MCGWFGDGWTFTSLDLKGVEGVTCKSDGSPAIVATRQATPAMKSYKGTLCDRQESILKCSGLSLVALALL